MIGTIYRIIHVESEIQYVGSTLNEPRKRWQQHKADYQKWLNGKHGKATIYPFFEQYGLDKFKLIPIKEYAVCDRDHLKAYEALWISKLKCVNEKTPFQITKMAKKHYRDMNKDSIKDKAKRYRVDNKDLIKAKDKRYYESKKEYLQQPFQCDCGGKYTRIGKARHFKTKKHQNWDS